RESDIAARLAGDEFVLVLPAIGQLDNAIKLAREIVAALGKPFQLAGHHVSVSVSVGISLYPADGHDASTLLKRADAAMYEAKRSGKNRYALAPDHA
ncbi:MAG TPA: GGDEF domain-containing protein, partial [Chloroflexota bacterium]|nr:GGDEF domain-containing protein [Chloroflexota bacterium]